MPPSNLARVWTLGLTAVLVHLCLYPWQFDVARTWQLSPPAWPLKRVEWVDCVVNLLVYLPWGILACWTGPWAVARASWRILGVAVAGGALSLLIESLQVYIPSRVASVRDVMLNAAGAAAGAALSHGLAPYLLRRPAVGLFGVFSVCWIVWLAFPFLPLFRFFKLTAAWESLRHPSFSLIAAGDTWFAAAAIWQAGQGSIPAAARAILLFGTLGAASLVTGLTLQPDRLAAAALAVAAVCFFPARFTPARFFLAGLGWIVCRQLYPWAWQEEAIPFHWLPLAGIGDSFHDSYLRILAGKLLIYATVIEQGWRAAPGAPRGAAILIVLVLLTLTEALQTHIPGRSPETTDGLLALVGAGLLAAAGPRQSRAAAHTPTGEAKALQ